MAQPTELIPNEETLKGLANLLQLTTTEQVVTATAQLTSLQALPGFSLCLLQLIAHPSVDANLKLCAAVQFKNFVLGAWKTDANTPNTIRDSDRATIKQHLIALMVSQPRQIQLQLGQALAIISTHDFPDRWQTLLPELVARMNSPEMDSAPEQLVGILGVMNSIFYRYRIELKSDRLWAEIKVVVTTVADPLFALFLKWCARLSDPQFSQNASALPTIIDIVAVISELFLSLSSQDIPAAFEEKATLQGWMSRFLELFTFQSALLEQQAQARKGDDKLAPTKLDALRSTICEIINVYTWKYEDYFAEFVPKFVEVIWQTLASLGDSPRFDALVGSAVRFLTAVVRKQQFSPLFSSEAALNLIAEKVIIPQLKLRETDQENFEMNPSEYVRVDIEGSDVDTRRRNTLDFIHGLLVHFEAAISVILKGWVDRLLGEYAAHAKTERGFLAKDAAMYIIVALSAKSKSAQTSGAKQPSNPYVDLGTFFSTQVLPELTAANPAEHPILKADALKFVAIFRHQLPRASYDQIMPLLLRFLGSESVVIHTYAAYAIERLLSVKEDSGVLRFDKTALKPYLQPMLTGLFGVLESQAESRENEYIMKAIMRVVGVGQEGLVEFAAIIIAKITAILIAVAANPKNPKFNHYMFEALAALVKYLCAGVGGAAPNVHLVDSFERALFPPFSTVLSTETAQDFGTYVFQILALLLEFRPDLSAPYVSIFPAILAPALWKNQGNIPAVTRLLQAYIRKPSFASGLLAAPAAAAGAPAAAPAHSKLEGILGIFQELLRLKSTEGYALDLLTSLVTDLDLALLSNYFQPLFNSMLFPKLQPAAKPTAKLFKGTTMFFLAFLARHGLETVERVLNTVQPGIFGMILGKIMLPHMHYASSEAERKLAVITLTNLMFRTPSFTANPGLLALWAPTMLATSKLLMPKASKELALALQAGAVTNEDGSVNQPEDEEDVLVLADKASSTAYARLVFAIPADRDYYPQIQQRPMEYFQQTVEQTCAAAPGKYPALLASLSEEEKTVLLKFFQTNKVNLR